MSQHTINVVDVGDIFDTAADVIEAVRRLNEAESKLCRMVKEWEKLNEPTPQRLPREPRWLIK